MSGVRLSGLGPSLGAAGSLAAAAVVMTLLIAGPRVWPSGPDASPGGSVRLAPVPARKVAQPAPTTVATPTLSAADPRPAATPVHHRATQVRPHHRRAAVPSATPVSTRTVAPGKPVPVTAVTPAPTTASPAVNAATPVAAATNSPAPVARTTPAPTPVATATPGPVERTVQVVQTVVAPVATVVATVVGIVQGTLDGVLQRKP